MARARRRMTRSPGRARQSRRRDWVFRSNVRDETGAVLDDLGSYGLDEKLVTAGQANAQIAVLYDSHNFLRSTFRGQGINILGSVLPPARAEGKRAFIHRVQGQVFYRPSAWAVGSTFRTGFRFGIFEQDPVVGGILIDPLYGMYSVSTADVGQAAQWANDRMWQLERRHAMTFSDNSQVWTQNFNFSVRRSLNANQAYVLYIESAVGSVNLIYQFWLRTLVSDEQ